MKGILCNFPSLTGMRNQSEQPRYELVWQAVTATLCRLVLNTARRFAYPFAPVLSRGLVVPLTAVTSLIAVNQATSILGIFFGPMADRLGYRRMMLAGLGTLALGMSAGGLLPFFAVVLAGLLLAGLGKTIFDPALQAYVGNRVPFSRRGMVIGVLEFSWAGSTLLGIPLLSLLIHRFGWRAPFFMLGGFGLLGVAALMHVMPADTRRRHDRGDAATLRRSWTDLWRSRASLGMIGYAFFYSAANDNLFVVFGAWLEQAFGLSTIGVGIGASIIGVAELMGEGLTASYADKMGLSRSVFLGLLFSAVCYGLLPLIAHSLLPALIGLFVLFLVFEFTVVSSLSLSTELMPRSRATMMSFFYAAAGIGRMAGALAGGFVWLKGGILATGIVSAGITSLAFISLTVGVRGWRSPEP
ncbi:MAG: MFS transporter [Thermodesulfobacteriota bacterium]